MEGRRKEGGRERGAKGARQGRRETTKIPCKIVNG